MIDILFCGACAESAPAPYVVVQDQTGVSVSRDDRALANALLVALTSGDFATALALLEGHPDLTQTPEGLRLKAELLVQLARADEAVVLLEGHLASDGADALARYQLGEIHFAARRDVSATLAYRLALVGNLDPLRRQRVQERLAALESRRRVRITASFGVAPDSNINNATSAGAIDLYGLPFVLSDDARRRSGVAASFNGGLERRWPVSDGLSVLAGGSIAVLDSSGGAFDQRQIGVFAGPEIKLGQDRRASLSATYRDAAFGGEPLETWTGVRIEGEAYVDQKSLWNVAVRRDRIDNVRSSEWSGSSYGGQVSRTRFLGPSAFWRASATVDTYDLGGAESGYQIVQLSAGRLFTAPFATLAYVEPYSRWRDFERRSVAFGVRRQDYEIGLNVRVSKRDWAVRNAFPYVQAVFLKSSSNVVIGDYSRQRVEFGLTRTF